MKTKPTMTDGEAMRKIKDLLARDDYAAIMSERKRINKETVPRFTALLTGLKLKYIETGETVIITEVGELFETIRARFPNGEVLWCSPEEFALIEQGPGRKATSYEVFRNNDTSRDAAIFNIFYCPMCGKRLEVEP